MEPGQLYQISTEKSRILWPEVFKMVILGVVFFVLILLNLRLARIDVPGFVFVLIVVILAILGAVQVLISLRKKVKDYVFFQHGVKVNGKKQEWYPFNQIQTGVVHKSLADKIFNTGSVKAGSLTIENIAMSEEVADYISRLRAQSGYAQDNMQDNHVANGGQRFGT